MIEKRKKRRFPASQMVTSIANTPEGLISQVCFITDISVHGLQMRSKESLEPGTPVLSIVRFVNRDGAEDESALFGIVSWVYPDDGAHHVGITLDDPIDPVSDRGLLEHFMKRSFN
ncbi:MAG: PilZ domain-containing protein [Nitrospirota bacterium]|nr:MAG: PilZ domain-containing protein [Nitrospirota bacterium]